jgi:hypothetical protein
MNTALLKSGNPVSGSNFSPVSQKAGQAYSQPACAVIGTNNYFTQAKLDVRRKRIL